MDDGLVGIGLLAGVAGEAHGWLHAERLASAYSTVQRCIAGSQVAAANKRGLLRRTMAAWRQLAVERWWKTQCAARDRQVALLEADLRAQRRRPVVVQANRRLRALLRQWQGVAAAARALRKRVLLVSHRSQARLCSGVWDAW